MKNSRAALAALTAGTVLALTACGGSGGNSTSSTGGTTFTGTPKGTLNAWAFDNADDVGKARLADAKQYLNGVTIKLDQTTFDSQKFTTRLAGGNVPDVVQMDRQYVATYAAQGTIMPLDKCFSAHHVNPHTLFYKSVLDDVTYKGHIWAVPQFYQPPAILINNNVMKPAGISTSQIDTSKPDQLIAAAKKMYKTNGNVPSLIGFNAVPTGQTNLWVVGLGGKLWDSNGKPTLSDASNVYPLELLKRITDAQGGWAKYKSFTDSFDVFGANNQFVKNQVGSEVDAQWYPNVLSPYTKKINIGAVPFRDKSGNPVAVAGGSSFVIPTRSSNPVAACAWAVRLASLPNWLAAGKARAQTLKKNGGINTGLFTGEPVADKKIRSMYVKSSGNANFDQVINTYYQVVDNGKSIGASPAGQAVQTALVNAVTATLLGQKSAKAALATAQQQAMNAYNNTAH